MSAWSGETGDEGLAANECVVCIAPDHPSLAGHFPGNPVVPGVVILQQVTAAIAARLGDCRPIGLSGVKFLKRVNPGSSLRIALTKRPGACVDFVCFCAGEPVAKGQFRIAPD